MFSPVFVAGVRGQGGEEDIERAAGTALHPSHTSNSQFLWKTGNFRALQKQQQPEQCCRVPWDRHTPFQENPHPRILPDWERGAAMPSCVPKDKSMTNPRQFLAFLPNHGQRRIPSSERLHPSKPSLWKGSRCQGYKSLPPQKGTFAQCPQR